MSVSECHVRGCPNVMCAYFSWKLQKYICYSCLERLKTKGILNKAQVLEFFDTEHKPDLVDDPADIEKYYSAMFSTNQ
jgi:hypothetical protein